MVVREGSRPQDCDTDASPAGDVRTRSITSSKWCSVDRQVAARFSIGRQPMGHCCRFNRQRQSDAPRVGLHPPHQAV